MSKEAMKLALEALEHVIYWDNEKPEWEYAHKAITALTAALEQQAQQEPVAYWIPKAEQFCIADPSGRPFAKVWEPLYTSPPAQRKPLTDEQKDATRYRWLRNPTTEVALVLDKRTNWVPPDEVVPGVGGYWEYEYRAGEDLDEAIDRAIEAAHGITGEKK